MPKPTRIVVLNGSLAGGPVTSSPGPGNTDAFVGRLIGELQYQASSLTVSEIRLRDALAGAGLPTALRAELAAADGFVFATGTYWDSWGSPLQRFFELATELEAGDTWLGKPAALLTTMHSVGGKEVLSRLQGVLNALGIWVPPMAAMTYSLANELALAGPRSELHDDLWQPRDLEVVAHNLLAALGPEPRRWRAWPVDGGDASRRWLGE